MKLSKLLTYKDTVRGLTIRQVYSTIEGLLLQISNDLNIQAIDFHNLKYSMKVRQQVILENLEGLDENLAHFKREIDYFFDTIEKPYFEKSDQIYQEGRKDDYNYKLDRFRFKDLLYEEETRGFFIGRVLRHADWRYPGVQIGPGLGAVTDQIVNLDPLYLVDEHMDMFKEVKQMWTPEYQKRLRYYVVNEDDTNPLRNLPANQMGLIVSVDWFNFRPLYLIERYLAGMMNILRPGGVAIFTYNNCDYPIGVDNFENSYYCYTPGHMITEICLKLGYRIISSFDMDNNVSWLEIQRPGTLSSLKGGQSLAAIKHLGGATPEEQKKINEANSIVTLDKQRRENT